MRHDAGIGFALTLLVLAGCKTTSEHYVALPSQSSDRDYQRINVNISSLNTRSSGAVVSTASTTFTLPLYYKLFRHENNLAICGYYFTEGFWSACDYIFRGRWFEAAMFSVNGKDIGDGGFFDRHKPMREGLYEAGCVITREPWNDSFTRATFS